MDGFREASAHCSAGTIIATIITAGSTNRFICVSAISFLFSYVMIFKDPAIWRRSPAGWWP